MQDCTKNPGWTFERAIEVQFRENLTKLESQLLLTRVSLSREKCVCLVQFTPLRPPQSRKSGAQNGEIELWDAARRACSLGQQAR